MRRSQVAIHGVVDVTVVDTNGIRRRQSCRSGYDGQDNHNDEDFEAEFSDHD